MAYVVEVHCYVVNSEISLAFPTFSISHSLLSLSNHQSLSISAYIRLVIVYLLIQLTKVHGPKRPALLPILCYAKCQVFIQSMGAKSGLRPGHSPDSSSCWSSSSRWLLGPFSSGTVVPTQGSSLLPSPPCVLHPMRAPPLHSSGLQSLLHICALLSVSLVTCQSLQCRLNHSPGMESDTQLPSSSLLVWESSHCESIRCFPKKPSQHAADLELIKSKPTLLPAFVDPRTGIPKQVYCIRVDGASDEGPSHHEVQFLWTEQHLESGCYATLVTCRNSGASYLNLVELQNGCLALGATGKIDEKKLKHNMDLATDVYLSRVDGNPCGETTIRLFKGADSSERQRIRLYLIQYLKGSNIQREAPGMNMDLLSHTCLSPYVILPVLGAQLAQTVDVIEKWICCDTCDRWYHFSCVGLTSEPDDFVCVECS